MNSYEKAHKRHFYEINKPSSHEYSLKFEAAWTQLASRTRQQDPFSSLPSWQLSYHDAFLPNRSLLIRSEAGSLIAFAERKLYPAKSILTPIESLWGFGVPLLGANSVELLSDTINDSYRHSHANLSGVLISGIAPRGRVLQKLKKEFDSKFDFIRASSGIQCAASLAGGMDGFLSRRSASHRRKLRKIRSKSDNSGLSFERQKPLTAEHSKEIYKRMISVELASWKGIGKCGMVGGKIEQFYKILLGRLAKTEDARIIFAKYEEKDIGFIFGGLAGNIYRGQQFSFDNEWSSASIGNLMQYEQINWLCEEGVIRYDMGPLLGQRMAYKRHWTERNFKIESWMLQKK